MIEAKVLFIFAKEGKPWGFAATVKDYWAQKIKSTKTIDTTMIFPLDKLKVNLRKMLKDKTISIVRAGTTEAVAVPESQINKLLL